MTKRRTILICIAGALATIFVAQILFGLRSPQKNFKVKETPDFISIENSDETILLEKNGDEWFCAEKKADAKKVERLLERFCEVQTLGVAARSSNEAALERYGLDAPITVRAKSGEKTCARFSSEKKARAARKFTLRLKAKKKFIWRKEICGATSLFLLTTFWKKKARKKFCGKFGKRKFRN